MPDNIVDISILCPLKFQVKDYANPAPYNTHFAEDWAYPDTIPDFYEQRPYLQPWQNNDIIYIQIISNYAPHNIELLDCNGNQVDTFAAAHVPTSVEDTGQKVYEAAIALTSYDGGAHYVRISSGTPILSIVESEMFDIKELQENSVLIKYKHDENDYDVVFETGIEFQLRTFGGFPIEQYKPGADRVVYIDQSRDAVLLSGRTYAIDKLIIGDAGGLPRYMIEKINAIFQCSSLTIDGKGYVVNDGATLEPAIESFYPMAGWGIDLRPASNKLRKRFAVDGNSSNPTTVVYNIETNGFGSITGPASSNIIQIESIND
jgi:hypothetical protein